MEVEETVLLPWQQSFYENPLEIFGFVMKTKHYIKKKQTFYKNGSCFQMLRLRFFFHEKRSPPIEEMNWTFDILFNDKLDKLFQL